MEISKGHTNGYRFWRYVEPYSGEEQTLHHLRNTTGERLAQAMAADSEFVRLAWEGFEAAGRGETYRLRPRD